MENTEDMHARNAVSIRRWRVVASGWASQMRRGIKRRFRRTRGQWKVSRGIGDRSLGQHVGREMSAYAGTPSVIQLRCSRVLDMCQMRPRTAENDWSRRHCVLKLIHMEGAELDQLGSQTKNEC